MKNFIAILLLSMIVLPAAAQSRKGRMIIMDTVEDYFEPTFKQKAIKYYYEHELWNPDTKKFEAINIPYIEADNKFNVYQRVLAPNAKEDPFEKIDYLAKGDSILKYLDTTSRFNFSKCYFESFVHNFYRSTTKENGRFAVLDSLSCKGTKKLYICHAVNIDNCIVNIIPEKGYDSLVFTEKFTVYSSIFKSFCLKNTVFKDTCELAFGRSVEFFTGMACPVVDGQKVITFSDVMFDKLFFLQNATEDKSDDPVRSYDALYITANSGDSAQKPISNMLFQNVSFKSVVIHSGTLKNMLFRNVTFDSALFLNKKVLDSVQFLRCTFNNLVDLRGAVFTNGTSFKGSYFNNSCNMIISSSDDIEKFRIDNIELGKIFFIMDWDWRASRKQYLFWDKNSMQLCNRQFGNNGSSGGLASPLDYFTAQDMEQVRGGFERIRKYVNKTVTNDDLFGSGKQKILNWLNYQEYQYDKEYCRRNNRPGFYKLWFLEFTVNYGYQGELKFIRICFFIIALFSLLFWYFCRGEMADYVNKGNNKEEHEQDRDYAAPKKRKKKRSNMATFFTETFFMFNTSFVKAFYTSFTTFFSLKFPSSVFCYSKKFIWFIIAEWTLGLGFVALFLFYIAGNYPIVTKLIGL